MHDLIEFAHLVNNFSSIKIPRDMHFKEVTMDLGASKAQIEDLNAGKLVLEVGAGQADVSRLIVDELKAEVGVGQLNITMNGKEFDYNYRIECGVGEVNIKFGL